MGEHERTSTSTAPALPTNQPTSRSGDWGSPYVGEHRQIGRLAGGVAIRAIRAMAAATAGREPLAGRRRWNPPYLAGIGVGMTPCCPLTATDGRWRRHGRTAQERKEACFFCFCFLAEHASAELSTLSKLPYPAGGSVLQVEPYRLSFGNVMTRRLQNPAT